jgi:hypothetical protein
LPAFRDCSSPGAALLELVSALDQEYSSAVEAGFPPQAGWLPPNPYYNLKKGDKAGSRESRGVPVTL